MDIALILLLIAIGILLVVMSLIKYQSHQTSMYERRMNTLTHYQQTLMLAARVHPTAYGAYLVIGVTQNGIIRYAFQPANGTLPTVTDNLTLAADHRAALEIVSESRKQYGGSGTKIIPANQWSSASEWDAAVKHMQAGGYVMTGSRGTIIKDNLTLDDLMLALAKSVPQSVISAPAA